MTTSQSLSFLLSEMAPVLDGLIGLSEEKQDVLVRGDVPRLEQLISSELDLITKLDRFERERVQLYEFMDGFHGDPDISSASALVHERLSTLKRLNDTNMVLVRSSLQVVQHGLRVLLPSASGYESAPMAGPLVFDRRS